MMTLIKYRDPQMEEYIHFWVDQNDVTMSPYFKTEQEAKQWIESFDNWRPSRDIA